MCIQLYLTSIIILYMYSFDPICVGPSWVNYWMIIPSRIKHRLRKMPHFPSKLGCLGLLEHRKHHILNQSHSSWTKKTWKIPLNPLKSHSFPLKTHHFYQSNQADIGRPRGPRQRCAPPRPHATPPTGWSSLVDDQNGWKNGGKMVQSFIGI